jgi:hypothetical protein
MLLSRWPGLSRFSRQEFAELQKLAPSTWNLDDLLGHISSESAFNPAARNKDSSAAGLIQMVDATARRFAGVSANRLAGMSAMAQLPSVVKYFSVGRPMAGADFKLLGFSRNPALLTAEPERVIYPAGSAAARVHLQWADAAGAMTVGSVREHWATVTAGTKGGPKIESGELRDGPERSAGGGLGWVALALAGAGALYYTSGKRKGRP